MTDREKALRDAAVAVATQGPASLAYDYARRIWAIYWAERVVGANVGVIVKSPQNAEDSDLTMTHTG